MYPEGQVAPLTNLLNGGPSSKTSLTGVDDDTEFAVTLENQGSGGHLNIPGILAATSSGVMIPTLSVTTLAATTANITTANIGTLNVSGNSNLGDAVGDTTTISGNAAVGQDLTVTRHATVNGNTALGNGDTDTVTVIGVSTFRNAANTATQLFVDAANNRALFGTATALTTAPDDKVSVVGGALHLAGAGTGTPLVQAWRYGAASTAYWGLKVSASANPDLMLHNDADTQVLRFMDSGLLIVGTATAAVGTAGAGDIQLNDLWLVNGANHRRLMVTSTSFQISANNDGTTAHLTLDASGVLTVPAFSVDTDAVIGTNLVVTNGDVTVSAGDVNVTGDVIASDEMQCGSTLAVGGAIISSSTGNVFSLTGSSQWQTTVGAAGGSSALPAAPAAYLKFALAGTNYVIPFYSAS